MINQEMFNAKQAFLRECLLEGIEIYLDDSFGIDLEDDALQFGFNESIEIEDESSQYDFICEELEDMEDFCYEV